MNDYVPEPWAFILLAFAAFRVWKLVADDRILDRPRDWLLGKMTDSDRQDYWGDFLVCPWCAGWWISTGVVWVSWLIFPTEAVVLAVPWALSAVVGSLGTLYFALTGD